MSDRKYLIIGDGIAGATAARTIRENDEQSKVTVLTDESEPLYNRIMLKSYMKGSLPGTEFTKLHDDNWYEKRDISLELETRVENVDREANEVITELDEKYSYDKLLIATGGSPRNLPQDEGFDNLHYMWTLGDAERIRESAEKAEKAVVIGGGLLGIDLAVAYAENGCDTKYLIRGDNWWDRGLDRQGAEIIHEKLEEKGCEIITNTEVDKIDSEGAKVKAVVATNGERYETDAVAVAIGQTPNSGIVDVKKNQENMIQADKYLQTSDSDIYAAGNMVEYFSPIFEKRTDKGSWDHSEAMGETAGLNMVKDAKNEGKDAFDYVNTYGVGHFDVQFLAIGDWTGKAESHEYEEDDHYRRLFYDGDDLVGVVMIGNTEGQEELRMEIQG